MHNVLSFPYWLVLTALICNVTAQSTTPTEGEYAEGTELRLTWTTPLDKYVITLWQQNLTIASANIGPEVYVKTEADPEDGEFNWTVPIGQDQFLSQSPKFFLWLSPTRDNTSVDSFASNYFNITRREAASSSSSFSSSSSSTSEPTSSTMMQTTFTTTDAASSTSTGVDPPSNRKTNDDSSHMRGVGLGIGLGLGIPTLALAAAGIILFVRRRRNTEKEALVAKDAWDQPEYVAPGQK